MSARLSSAQRICVAKIGTAHGVQGEVKLWSYTAEPVAVADYGALETEDGTKTFEIESLRPGKDFLVARLKGVSDRNAAEKLRNIELFIARDKLPKIKDTDEFYHTDLIGLAAVDSEGAPLGTIVAIHNFGAGDLIEVRPMMGGDTVMVPFTAALVPEVDVAGGKVVINPPQDLFNPR